MKKIIKKVIKIKVKNTKIIKNMYKLSEKDTNKNKKRNSSLTNNKPLSLENSWNNFIRNNYNKRNLKIKNKSVFQDAMKVPFKKSTEYKKKTKKDLKWPNYSYKSHFLDLLDLEIRLNIQWEALLLISKK